MSTILLIEPHPLLRLGLHQLLRQLDLAATLIDIEPSGGRLQDEAQCRQAELLIYGFTDDADDAGHELRAWCERLAPQRVLVLSDRAPALPVATGLPATVRGWLCKTNCAQALAAAVRLVLAGGECFPAGMPTTHLDDGGLDEASTALAARLISLDRVPGAAPSREQDSEIETPALGAHRLNITERQYEVLVLLARGYPIKTVSRLLNISVATAKTHACSLYQRLHVRNKSEAVYAALQRGARLNWPGPKLPARSAVRDEAVAAEPKVFQAA